MQRTSARSWLRAAAVAGGVFLTVAAVVAGTVVVRFRSIQREHFRVGTLAEAERGEPKNFLVVGTDSRRFVDGAADAASFGTAEQVGGAHADTILLVRTFPDLDRVAMLSLPRDLVLDIAGTGRQDRINTALQGGPDRLARTIAENLGVPVNHFVEVDFRGFRALVDAIGGVTVNVPAPARDWDDQKQVNPTGLEIGRAGCVELGGQQALAWVRSRHYQELVDGVWRSDPAGDLSRTTRQQEFIRQTVGQSVARGLRNPARLNALIEVAMDNVTLDDQLGFRDLATLSRQFRDIGAQSLQGYALPTTPAQTADGADVLRLDGPSAEPVLDVFRGRTTSTAALVPSAVRVQVIQEPGRSGAADAAAFRLAAAGFVVEPTTPSGARTTRTVIEHAAGGEAKAELLRSRLAGPAELRVSGSVQGIDAVLTIGRDWRGVADTAPAPGSATAPPTTAPTTAPRTGGAHAAGTPSPTTAAPAAAPTPTCQPRR